MQRCSVPQRTHNRTADACKLLESGTVVVPLNTDSAAAVAEDCVVDAGGASGPIAKDTHGPGGKEDEVGVAETEVLAYDNDTEVLRPHAWCLFSASATSAYLG